MKTRKTEKKCVQEKEKERERVIRKRFCPEKILQPDIRPMGNIYRLAKNGKERGRGEEEEEKEGGLEGNILRLAKNGREEEREGEGTSKDWQNKELKE